jgi:uncharacterized protein YlxP (DUF503 family)
LITVVLTFQIGLPQVTSLKEKRRILKSLMTRLRNEFNISIAEVADNDFPRSATIGAATVSNSNRFAHQVMDRVVARLASNPEVILGDWQIETC